VDDLDMKVGVVLPTGPRTGSLVLTDSQWSFAEIRRFALEAEGVGIDSLWVLDHLLFRLPTRDDGGIWEAWTIISAVAAATSRAALGTLVLGAPFRNPALVAKMAATLDEVSQGRLILGLGAGWHEPEFRAFGFPHSRLVDRFAEAIQIISALLRTGMTTFVGTYYQADNAILLPPGPRPGAIPLLVGAEGLRMLGLVIAYADAYNTAWYGWPSNRLRDRIEAVHEACREQGRDPLTLELTVGVTLGPATFLGDAERVPQDDPGAIVRLLNSYDELGVAHVICALTPADRVTLRLLGKAIETYRQGKSVALRPEATDRERA
jgi:alkanesulfonate monooxygenase SsuD/methylene tetrahydromethanopterin reductase-like flavin-dependent oxidoreductase (luciferase family)